MAGPSDARSRPGALRRDLVLTPAAGSAILMTVGSSVFAAWEMSVSRAASVSAVASVVIGWSPLGHGLVGRSPVQHDLFQAPDAPLQDANRTAGVVGVPPALFVAPVHVVSSGVAFRAFCSRSAL